MNLKTFFSDCLAIAVLFIAQFVSITIIFMIVKPNENTSMYAVMITFVLTIVIFYLRRGKFTIPWSLLQALITLAFTNGEFKVIVLLYGVASVNESFGVILLIVLTPVLILANKYFLDRIANRIKATLRVRKA